MKVDITNVGAPLDVFAPVGKPVVDLQRCDPLQIRQLLSCDTHRLTNITFTRDTAGQKMDAGSLAEHERVNRKQWKTLWVPVQVEKRNLSAEHLPFTIFSNIDRLPDK